MGQGSRFTVFCLVVSALVAMGSVLVAQEPLKEPSRGVVTGVPTQQPYGGNLLVLLKAELGSQVLGFVSNGDEVTIADQIGSFYHITAPKDGWCWASYIQVTETRPAQNNQQPLSIEEFFNNSKVTPQARELADPNPAPVPPDRNAPLVQELREYWQRMGMPASGTP